MNTQTISIEKKRKPNYKRSFYLWHKRLGIIVLIPIVLWTLSGIMHPFIANWFKPQIARSIIMPAPLGKNLPKLSLQEVMKQQGIRALRNFSLIEMDGVTYYQIKDTYNRLQYYEANTGKKLSNGDQQYAEYLARYFAGDQTSYSKIAKIEQFNGQYREVNRLLPVYKISFTRSDGLDVYVETEHSRMGTYNTNSRKAFLWIFQQFHNWAFLDDISATFVRVTIQLLFLTVILAASLSGLIVYGLMWKRFKSLKKPKNSTAWLRKYHRQIGLLVTLVVFTFGLSGAFHAFTKYTPDERQRFVKNSIFTSKELTFDTSALPWKAAQAHSASVIRMPQGEFFQLMGKGEDGKAQTYYINAQTGEEYKDGDYIYARYLANKFKAHKANIDAGVSFSCCLPPDTIPDGTQIREARIIDTELITGFSGEYSFINKRLPVVKVDYAEPQVTYFIETSSSQLSAIVAPFDLIESYSFGTFHKFHFVGDWLNKDIRDGLLVFSALGVVSVSLLGLAVYVKKS